jgi:hypothetical protein
VVIRKRILLFINYSSVMIASASSFSFFFTNVSFDSISMTHIDLTMSIYDVAVTADGFRCYSYEYVIQSVPISSKIIKRMQRPRTRWLVSHMCKKD